MVPMYIILWTAALALCMSLCVASDGGNTYIDIQTSPSCSNEVGLAQIKQTQGYFYAPRCTEGYSKVQQWYQKFHGGYMYFSDSESVERLSGCTTYTLCEKPSQMTALMTAVETLMKVLPCPAQTHTHIQSTLSSMPLPLPLPLPPPASVSPLTFNHHVRAGG